MYFIKTSSRYIMHSLLFWVFFRVRMPVTARDNSTENSTKFCLSILESSNRVPWEDVYFFSRTCISISHHLISKNMKAIKTKENRLAPLQSCSASCLRDCTCMCSMRVNFDRYTNTKAQIRKRQSNCLGLAEPYLRSDVVKITNL